MVAIYVWTFKINQWYSIYYYKANKSESIVWGSVSVSWLPAMPGWNCLVEGLHGMIKRHWRCNCRSKHYYQFMVGNYIHYSSQLLYMYILIMCICVTTICYWRLKESLVKFYIFTIMATFYKIKWRLHLVQLPTFVHREHLIASKLIQHNIT